MLQLSRIYKNSAGEEIRIDSITLNSKRSNITLTNAFCVYERNVSAMTLAVTADTAVSKIEIMGNFDSYDKASGSFLWAEWNSPSARVNMSDLPAVGDTL